MRILGRSILLLVVLLLAARRAWPASGAENQAFTAAEKVYLDADYKNAEAYFADFIQKYPGSTRIPEALLYQAQALIKLGDFNGALSLLSAHQSQAGALADWYLLCQGEALLAKGDYPPAEANFARLLREFPSSPRRLAAVVDAAIARMRLSKWPQVIELLNQTNGVFQTVAATNRASPFVIKGYLLLSEAELAQNDTHAAELALQALAGSPLDSTNNWQRQYLLCRVLQADGRLEAAMQNTTNLLLLADATGQRSFQAEATAFQAGLLERLGRREEALTVYRKNLIGGIPADRQRQALLKIAELSLALEQIGGAAQVLQTFLGQFPTNDCSDLALLTLGELRLHQFEFGGITNAAALTNTNPVAVTNFLEQAIAEFHAFETNFPHSALSGKAQLDLGWCYWLGGKISESQAAFQRAAALLPPSADQARAFFKLADIEFQRADYTAAISNYNQVVERFANLPEVQTNLSELALYQIVRAGQAAGDLTSATNALARILATYPNGFYNDRAVLLTGEQMAQHYPAMARALYCDFARSATNSQLLPELELAIARTYEEETNWSEAIRQYDTWLVTFTNHPAQARAEYFRAQANYEAGDETNAVLQFTNFIARFPTNGFAPLAQWRVADYFFGLGNLLEAERNYKFVSENWASSPLAYPARMMAGRVAVARQGWEDAPGYFTNLVNDPNCPADLRAQALFAYGDTLLSQNSTNKVADSQEAFKTFDLICKTYGTNQIAASAWGQKAICLLQFARTPQDYGSATNAFQKVIEAFQQVIESPLADASARSIAEVGLGFTLEKLAETKADPEKSELLNAAKRHYQRVFYDNSFLRDGEKPDPFWTSKAGLELGRLNEQLKLREEAINVYRTLQEMFPPLRLEDKIKALRAQAEPSI